MLLSGRCRPLPPHPSLLSRSSTWEIYFCCITGDAQTIPGNHRCHQTCHSHQPRAAGAAPRAQAALGCCLREARQQKGAGRGLHRRGVSNPKMLPPQQEGRKGGHSRGEAAPVAPPCPVPWLHLLHRGHTHECFKVPRSLGHLWRRDVTEMPTTQPCGSVFGGSICFWGYRRGAADRTCWAWGWGGCGCFPPAEDTSQFVSVG